MKVFQSVGLPDQILVTGMRLLKNIIVLTVFCYVLKKRYFGAIAMTAMTRTKYCFQQIIEQQLKLLQL